MFDVLQAQIIDDVSWIQDGFSLVSLVVYFPRTSTTTRNWPGQRLLDTYKYVRHHLTPISSDMKWVRDDSTAKDTTGRYLVYS